MKKLITMLSALTITSSLAPLTVACKDDTKAEGIDLNNLKAEMIINSKDKYEIWEHGPTASTTEMSLDDIKKLDNGKIKEIIANNLTNLFVFKLTGLKQKDIADHLNDKKELSDSKLKNLIIFQVLSEAKFINTKVEPIENQEKQLNITVTVKKWDDIKNDIEETIKESIKNNENIDKNTKGTKFEMLYSKIVPTLDPDTCKKMYDLIKGESKTIELNLNTVK